MYNSCKINLLGADMQILLETTNWGEYKTPNHTYYVDGTSLVAYIKSGETKPFYFKQPIKNFDKRGRTFKVLKKWLHYTDFNRYEK